MIVEEFGSDNNNFSAFSHSTRLLAATTLRNVLGTKNLSQILGLLHDCLNKCSLPTACSGEGVDSAHDAECAGRGHGPLGSQGGARGDVSVGCCEETKLQN